MDYAQIKLDDPGGDLNTAFAALQALTVDVVSALDSNQLTIWAGKHNAIPSMEADVGATEGVSKAALTLLTRANGSLDTEDADVQTMLASLVATGVLTQAAVDDLTTMATTTNPKYPGLTIGHLTNAGLVMAISANDAIRKFGTATDLSTTATTTTIATTVISVAGDLDEWTNTDDASLVSFLLEVDDWSGAPTAGETIDLYYQLLNVSTTNDEPLIDASYTGHYAGYFVVDAASAAQYLVIGPVGLIAFDSGQEYQFNIVNNTSVTMGSTDNKWRLKVMPNTYGPAA